MPVDGEFSADNAEQAFALFIIGENAGMDRHRRFIKGDGAQRLPAFFRYSESWSKVVCENTKAVPHRLPSVLSGIHPKE